MPSEKTDRPLVLLPRDIAALTGGAAPTHRRALEAARDGRIPAERGDNGRWSYRPADLPAIAAALGFRVPHAVAA
ncbi:hypothetical protein [Siccirubricoccus phaeus]|uniref:hypothetical protein n=1 Tax=Siccirubricoccus phaeus TaxID=2595053 RepID=UPI0011F1A210|nr:hypothetical protein [Siccirubricoccus phaeus]